MKQGDKKTRRAMSLGTLLIVALAGMQLLAVLIVVSHSYLSSERVLLDHARSLLRDLASNTTAHVRGFLDPAKDGAILMSQIVQDDPDIALDPEKLERLLFQQLQVTQHLSGIYFGDAAGNFIYVMHSHAEEGPYRTKLISRNGARRDTTLIWRDENYRALVQRNDPDDTYDPRDRPWYQGVLEEQGLVWTDPYIFFTARSPGITVAAPVHGEDGTILGVVGVDIQIDKISNFLATLEGGVRGTAFVTDAAGNVLAHPDVSLVREDEETGQLRFPHVTEVADPVVRAAFGSIFQQAIPAVSDSTPVSITFANEQYLAMLVPMEGLDLGWTIALYAAEEDFVGGITQSRRDNTVLATLVALTTALIGLYIARSILHPVRELAERARRLDRGHAVDKAPFPTTFHELQRANDAMVRQNAERMKTELEYGQTFDLATRGMAQIAPDSGSFLKVNKRFAEMVGVPATELLERSVVDFSTGEATDRLDRFDLVADGEPAARRLQMKRADGDIVWVEVNAIPIKDMEGRLVHTVATIDDVSDKVSAEDQIRRLSNELAHSARLNTMGQMAASLAHELNQPLTAITQNVDAARLTAQEQLPNDPELSEILGDLGEQAHRAGEIIATLREFISRDKVVKTPLDLSNLIVQTVGLVRPDARAQGVDMIYHPDAALPEVVANRVQVAQVLVNLLRNGLDSMGTDAHGSEINVTTEIDGGTVVTTVEDMGAGVADGVQLFAPFSTTKAKGMGLGLTICKSIIESHGGKLWHEHRPGGGARFRFSLPVAEGGEDQIAAE